MLEVFNLESKIASGSYNCAFALVNKPNEVLRIGLLIDDASRNDENRRILRGLELVRVFQSFGNRLGPSLLRELSKYRIVKEDDLDDHVEGIDLCEEILNTLRRLSDIERHHSFALQHIERLHGGRFTLESFKLLHASPQELHFSLFSLVWFIASAQQMFNYRHHDLKSGNILFKVLPHPETYYFNLEANRYTFTSRLVPVVIDYDMASIELTQEGDNRNAAGTLYTMPPDVCVAWVQRLHGESWNDTVAQQDLYDYWSLGICVLELLLPFDVGRLFFDRSRAFAAEAVDVLDWMEVELKAKSKNWFRAAFYGYAMQHVVGNLPANADPPPWDIWKHFASDSWWTRWYVELQNDADFKKVSAYFSEKFPVELKPLVRSLMNRQPKRTPMNFILETDLFNPYRTDDIYTFQDKAYKGFNVPILGDRTALDTVDPQKYRWITHRMCMTCRIESKALYLCSCCAQPFCGPVCQKYVH
jgi:serine/threonine protein kinase